MKPAAGRRQDSSDREVLAGLVERVTFHNLENGFCVLRTKARGHRDLVTVVGHAAMVGPGEWITASGEWVNDRTHGQQFKARFMRTSEPSSVEGIEKCLGSGMIRGIGPVYARKLVRAFGEKVFDVIEAEPERLREVKARVARLTPTRQTRPPCGRPAGADRLSSAWLRARSRRKTLAPHLRIPVSRQAQPTTPGGSLLCRPLAESSTGVDTWARVAVQRDPTTRAKYAALRTRGHGHALRSVADWLIAVACAKLENQTPFDPEHPRQRHAA